MQNSEEKKRSTKRSPLATNTSGAPTPQLDFLKSGDTVIIRQNPHHVDAVDIVGTVIVFRPREGFGESDLVDVRYKHPKNGRGFTMPFGVSCLGSADPASLIALAEFHERIAKHFRVMAAKTRPSD